MVFLFILLLLVVIFGRCTSYPFNCSPSWFTTCSESNDKNLDYIIVSRLTIDRLWGEAQIAQVDKKISEEQFISITSSLNDLTLRLNSIQDIVEWGRQGLIDKHSVRESMVALRKQVDIVVKSIERII